MIRFACPHCQTGLRARDDKAGRSARCPKCRSAITVPAGQGESAPALAAEASLPISDSKDHEPGGERPRTNQRTSLTMLGLFLGGLVCGTVLFAVLFLKIKEARLSRPVHAGHGPVRPALGKPPHFEPPPPHRFDLRATEEEKVAGQSESARASPAGTPVRQWREAKEEEYEAQPPRFIASPAPRPEGQTAAAADDSALRESEALVAPYVKDFRHQKLVTRLQAIEAVARMGPQGRAASRALCDGLLDPSPRIRLAASLALDKVNPALHRLVIPILVDKELDRRLECLRQVGRLGPAGGAAVPVVVYCKQQYLGGALAIDVLAAIASDDPSVTAKLAAWLTSDPDPYVRLAAAKALPHMAGAKGQIHALVQSLRTDPVDGVRAAAANALGDLKADARDADRGLRMAKADASAQVREAAERALEKMQKSASGEALAPR